MKSRGLLLPVLRAVVLVVGVEGCDQRFAFDLATAGAAGSGDSEIVGGAPARGGASGAASGGSSGSAGVGAVAASGGSSTQCGSLDACSLDLHCADEHCVQCAGDLDCAVYALPRCEPARHRCVACVTTADCADGFACDSLANRCLQTCRTENDCPQSAHGCDEGRQVCYQCDEDHECATSALGPLCASDGSGCVQCRKDTDCPNQHCDQLLGRCVDCRDGLDCDSGLCSPTTFSCVAN